LHWEYYPAHYLPHYLDPRSGFLEKASAHTAYPTHYLDPRSGFLEKVSSPSIPTDCLSDLWNYKMIEQDDRAKKCQMAEQKKCKVVEQELKRWLSKKKCKAVQEKLKTKKPRRSSKSKKKN
jgi:acyl-homoserine lactone acylase PvdQ